MTLPCSLLPYDNYHFASVTADITTHLLKDPFWDQKPTTIGQETSYSVMKIHKSRKVHFSEGTTGRFCFLTWRNSSPCKRSMCHMEWVDGSQTLRMFFIDLVSWSLCCLVIIFSLEWSSLDYLLHFWCLSLQMVQ